MFDDKKKTALKKIILAGLLCLWGNVPAAGAVLPRGDIKEGNRLYTEGDYRASKEKYREALTKAPESDVVHFNLGTALYKEKEYKEAVDHFQRTLLSEDEALKEKAHYNSGNALYKFGIAHEGDDPALAASSLEKALGQYERALSIDKEDEDTKHNYEYVKKELVRLKEKQPPQPQQGRQQKSDESKDQEQQQQTQDQHQEGRDRQQKQDRQEQPQEQEDRQDQQQPQAPPQDQQEKSDQEHAQTGEEDYNKQQGREAQPQNAQELTREEARMLLESYQQTEEPQGPLSIHPEKRDPRPVSKDW